MAFDPNKYLEEKTGQTGFDPNKYLAEKTGQAPIQDISKFQSAMSGIVEAPMFTDEIAAGGKALMDTVTGITPVSNTLENYRRQRDIIRGDFKKNAEANPMSHLAGNLAGSFAVPMGALQGASPITQGLAIGGAAGLGGSEAELTTGDIGQVGQAITDTAQGAAIGGVTSPILHKLLGKLAPEALDEFSKKRVVKAIGANKPQIQRLLSKKMYDKAGKIIQDESQFDEFTERVFKNKIVTSLSTAEDALERFQALKQTSGEEIEAIIKQLDASAPGVLDRLESKFFDPSKVASEIETKLLKPIAGEPLLTQEEGVARKVIETLAKRGNNPISFEEAQGLKQVLKRAAYDNRGEVKDQTAHEAYGIINKAIEDAVQGVAESVGNKDLLEKYINAKKNYSTGMLGETIALGKTAASMANRDLGLTDYIAGAAGAAAHGTPGGLLAAGFNKLAKVYDNPLMATTARGASKLFSLPKQGLQQVAQKLSTQGETGQKLSKMLLEAAERDNTGKNALLFTLMQQPAYRNLLDSQFETTNPGSSNVR